MLNPNVPKVTSDYERVENLLASLTPDPRDFEGRTYPTDEVMSDIKQLDDFRLTPGYKKSDEQSNSKLLEETFTDMAERGDWFSENEAYGSDPDYLALVTFPASDIDDTFNHVDVVGMIENEATEHEMTPFAIDLTYNTDSEKLTQKFRWKHAYGKRQKVPEKISEFGDSYVDKDSSGQDVLKTRPLPLKFRYGLKIPGFASVKYFEDKNNSWDPMYEKGRIEIMPRFIVGYSAKVADTLASEPPSEEFRWNYGEQAYQEKKAEIKNAERRAKWCTLLECKNQASDIRFMMEHLDSEETKWMHPDDFEKAKKQIVAMDKYFTNAVELATKKAQDNPDEMAAMERASSDAVCKAIIRHSKDTYISKNWK